MKPKPELNISLLIFTTVIGPKYAINADANKAYNTSFCNNVSLMYCNAVFRNFLISFMISLFFAKSVSLSYNFSKMYIFIA